jgi:ATP-binding cassette, subfamily B, bacterial
MKFPVFLQHNSKDCGPACLKMVSAWHGIFPASYYLRQLCETGKAGTSLLHLEKAAQELGFNTMCAAASITALKEEAPLPCIITWGAGHYVVLYRIEHNKFYVADPAKGKKIYSEKVFEKNWKEHEPGQADGWVLLLEPAENFKQQSFPQEQKKTSFTSLYQYLSPFKKQLLWMFVTLLLTTAISLCLPLLTSSIVDKGIAGKDLKLIVYILAGQLTLVFSQSLFDFLRSYQLLSVSNKISLQLISGFLKKLLRLPLNFFGSHLTGDLIQRVNDHYRVETFLTAYSLNTIFSVLNILVFGALLFYYGPVLFLVFLIAAMAQLTWLMLFLKRRKKIDQERFENEGGNIQQMVQVFTNVQEIKLNNGAEKAVGSWEAAQQQVMASKVKALRLEQLQHIGAGFIVQAGTLIITYLAARKIIALEMTLGEMLAIQFFIGQLMQPINSLIDMVIAGQNAKISWGRLTEIHTQPDEREAGKVYSTPSAANDIVVENVSFYYPGTGFKNVLQDIDCVFEKEKLTAIVGTSGSGKTTLLKLLLQYYQPGRGCIKIADTSLHDVDPHYWRQCCGVVLQDGKLLNTTVAGNICLDGGPDEEKVNAALAIANLQEFVQTLPNGIETKIGQDGVGLSGGQQQRLLIARAVYHNPPVLLLDEATNALDTANEKAIVNNLYTHFAGRTMIVVAHRLSTVKNADKIIVLHNGLLIETGTHEQLVALKGRYYELVKNQLELNG